MQFNNSRIETRIIARRGTKKSWNGEIEVHWSSTSECQSVSNANNLFLSLRSACHKQTERLFRHENRWRLTTPSPVLSRTCTIKKSMARCAFSAEQDGTESESESESESETCLSLAFCARPQRSPALLTRNCPSWLLSCLLSSSELCYKSDTAWQGDRIPMMEHRLHPVSSLLHYVTLHYITLHYTTLHYITLQHITLH